MGKFVVQVDGKSDVGLKRKNNEDNFCVEEKAGLFVVADGVGGSKCGEVASKMAVDVIKDYINTSKQEQELLDTVYYNQYSPGTNKIGAAVRVANKTIHGASERNPKYKGMATTVAAVLLSGERLSIAHVGDSRVYLVRTGFIEQLTDDHSLVAEQVRKGLITSEEARTDSMRNVITRSLGYAPEVEVDLDEMDVHDGDVLLLCSDGPYTMVPDNTMLHTIHSAQDPKVACERLVDFANKKGGKDNVTVIVAYIRKKKWYSFVLNLFK